MKSSKESLNLARTAGHLSNLPVFCSMPPHSPTPFLASDAQLQQCCRVLVDHFANSSISELYQTVPLFYPSTNMRGMMDFQQNCQTFCLSHFSHSAKCFTHLSCIRHFVKREDIWFRVRKFQKVACFLENLAIVSSMINIKLHSKIKNENHKVGKI